MCIRDRFQGFETERIFEFQDHLEDAVGVPVQVQLTVVPASLTIAGGESDAPPEAVAPVLPSDGE